MQFEKIGSFGVHVWPLSLEHLVETLALEAAPGHCEVDKGHSGAEIRRELHLRREEEREGGRRGGGERRGGGGRRGEGEMKEEGERKTIDN